MVMNSSKVLKKINLATAVITVLAHNILTE